MKKILNQFDAQGIRSGMATPSCCCSCCCSCVGTFSIISSEMIMRSEEMCGGLHVPNNSGQETFSILPSLKRILFITMLITMPVLLLSPFILVFRNNGNLIPPVIVISGVLLYYLGIIIYFAKKSQMTSWQYFFLALRIAVLFSIEFVVVLVCSLGESVIRFFVAALVVVCTVLLEYWFNLKRGVTQRNAIRQTGIIMGVLGLVYSIVFLVLKFA